MKNSAKKWLRGSLKLLLVFFVVLAAFTIYIDAWLLEKFEGKKWSLPAEVYARPLELFEGRQIAMDDVVKELQAVGYEYSAKRSPGNYFISGSSLHIYLKPFHFWDGPQKTKEASLRFRKGEIVSLRTDDNAFSVRLEPLLIGKIHTRQKEERLLVTLDQVPQSLIDALIVTEDRAFYDHFGISLRSIARAAWANLKEGRVVEGGSTLTQQLVKNFFLSSERSFVRKGLEAYMAILLEFHASKDEILEAYINEVYVAQDGPMAIHGFGLASEYFFGKPLSTLAIEETALLVAMMKGPSYYHPVRHPERALKRRNLVLQLLADQGKLTQAAADKAKARPINVEVVRHRQKGFPAYLDLVRQQLSRDYSEEDLTTEGLRIFTNCDPQWQWRASSALSAGIEKLEQRYGAAAVGMQGAAVIVHPETGDVLAVVGGRYEGYGYNRAIFAQRHIGSLMKPVIYLTAFQRGYSLASLVQDQPVKLEMPSGVWEPKNFDKQSHGDVTAYEALIRSYNLAAVNLGLSLGLEDVHETLFNLGLNKDLPLLPASLLGAVELSAIEVAQVYSTIAANGFYAELNAIREITDHEGQALRRYPLKFERRIEPEYQHLLNYALHGVLYEGTARSVQSDFAESKRVAGKTGTSNDQRDSWFAGYDAQHLAVVWLGKDDYEPLPVTGSSGALQVWRDIMIDVPVVQARIKKPENVVNLWIDKKSGKLSSEQCKHAVLLPFVKGTEPKEAVECTEKRNTFFHWFKKWF